ncbi:MAG TPA: hypothetical protein VJ249_02110 [Candidatus Bathyarchaeia archaeon]|nr:hypothetical protein [Candidatus Bathyarchaeia archaeon]
MDKRKIVSEDDLGTMRLSDDYLFELEEWLRHMINEAEENGDICKRNQFLALRAELLLLEEA